VSNDNRYILVNFFSGRVGSWGSLGYGGRFGWCRIGTWELVEYVCYNGYNVFSCNLL